MLTFYGRAFGIVCLERIPCGLVARAWRFFNNPRKLSIRVKNLKGH